MAGRFQSVRWYCVHFVGNLSFLFPDQRGDQSQYDVVLPGDFLFIVSVRNGFLNMQPVQMIESFYL